MFFDSIRQGEVLTVAPEGRLDAASAVELDQFLDAQDAARRFTSLILDMRETVYLSSAGLRILTKAAKTTHSRGGLLAVFGLQPYCQEVIRTVGMDKIFHCFATAAEAAEFCGLPPEPAAAEAGSGTDLETMSGKFIFNRRSSEPTALVVGGDIAEILHSRLEPPLVHGRELREIPFSLGFGALGNAVSDYMARIGHLMTFDRAVFWTPADGQECPDFLIPADPEAEFAVQSGFNLALHGEFNEIALFEANDTIGAELEAVWHDLLRLAAQRWPGFRGMVGAAMLAETGSAYVSDLRRPPLLENAPVNGKMINHASNLGEWYKQDMMPSSRNGISLITGVGASLQWDLSDYSENLLARIFPMTPAELSGRRCLLHNHAAVFTPLKVEWRLDRFAEESRRVMNEAALQRVGELQERSLIKRAVIALSYPVALEMPRQLDSLYARRLDYQLNRNLSLLKTYKALDEKHQGS